MLIHGSVSDYRTWNHQTEEISKNYLAIVYSRRFHWPNEKISEKEDYSMNQHVSDLEEILRNTSIIQSHYKLFVIIKDSWKL